MNTPKLLLKVPLHQKMLAPKRQFGADSSEAYREMRPISALSNTPQTARRMQILKIQRVAAIHTTFISRRMNPGVHISRCTIGEPILKNSLKNLRKVLLHLRSSVRRSILMDIRSSKKHVPIDRSRSGKSSTMSILESSTLCARHLSCCIARCPNREPRQRNTKTPCAQRPWLACGHPRTHTKMFGTVLEPV